MVWYLTNYVQGQIYVKSLINTKYTNIFIRNKIDTYKFLFDLNTQSPKKK
jgi:hypothetical protein